MSKTILKISNHIPSALQQRMDFSGGRAISLIHEHPAEKIMRRFAIIAILVLAFGYLYFVSDSVLNVMARKEALSSIAKIRSGMSVMEHEYFALTDAIKPSMGASIGLVPVTDTEYVHRAGNTAYAGPAGAGSDTSI